MLGPCLFPSAHTKEPDESLGPRLWVLSCAGFTSGAIQAIAAVPTSCHPFAAVTRAANPDYQGLGRRQHCRMFPTTVTNPPPYTHLCTCSSGQRPPLRNFFSSSTSGCQSPLLLMPFNPVPCQTANKISTDIRFWPRNSADPFELNILSTTLIFCQKKA